MTTPYNQVKEFHIVFGHPVEKTPLKDLFTSNQKLVDFRISLIDEEIKEFLNDGLSKKNLIEAIDALADTLYVVFGACLAVGINYDEMFSETLAKMKELDDKVNTDTDDFNSMCKAKNFCYAKYGETVENKNLQNSADLRNLLFDTMCDAYINDKYNIHVRNLLRAHDKLKKANHEKDIDKFANELNNIVLAVYTISEHLSVNMYKVFCEVHRSNMTKVCVSEDEAKKTVESYIQNDKRYDSPSYKLSPDGKYWVVYNKSTSKILKSINFELPNIKQFI